ncbi:MAG: hypothetical protein JXA99_08520 [Candidatus Lokiarchaeota archaeon]|nr:hypothetical protein [Candidatus Lokiarchaeota archaeon]
MKKQTKIGIFLTFFLVISSSAFLLEMVIPNGQDKVIFKEPKIFSFDDPLQLFTYAIITNKDLKDYNGAYSFHTLIDSKIAQGISATIVTVEEIYSRYDGRDYAEKIRAFIVDKYFGWGLQYVLLGGDSNIIPPRYFCSGGDPPPGQEWGPDDVTYYSDQYYATINNDWDDNNNRVYGEVEDWEILRNQAIWGYHADVYLGRAPVGSVVEVSNFVRKTLAHEQELRNYNTNYLYNGLMVGEFYGYQLDPGSDPGDPIAVYGGDYLDQLYMYNGYEYCSANGYQTRKISNEYTFKTLYERSNYNYPYVKTWTPYALLDIIESNNGVHILNHFGRPETSFCTATEDGYGPGYVYWEDELNSLHDNMMKLNINDIPYINVKKPFFLYSYQSYAFNYADEIDQNYIHNANGFHFTYDSIGERLITSPNGAFAAIGTSEYAWSFPTYTPDDPTDIPGQKLYREFYDAIFGEGIDEISRALTDAKYDVLKSYDTSYRLVEDFLGYEVFGDPMVIIRPQQSIFDKDQGPHDYVIITNKFLKYSNGPYTLQDLIEYKSFQGYNPIIITIEEIYAEYKYFRDEEEKIREFIKDAYYSWCTEYVFIIGDENEVPMRMFYIDEVFTYTDLYYAYLDGSWDADYDGNYGEFKDDRDNWRFFFTHDSYTEVAVGRAPVDTEEELSNFIRKTILHELEMESRDDDYLYSVLIVGEYGGTFEGIPYWGSYELDELIYNNETNGFCLSHGYTTRQFDQYYNITTLYDRESMWNKEDLIPIINNNIHIITHVGHSNRWYNMRLLYPDDIDRLANSKPFFLYTDGCDVFAYPGYSIGGRYLSSPNAAFAVIGSTGMVEYNGENTNFASCLLRREFYDAQFGEGILKIGKALLDAKKDFILQKPNWLVGDPSMEHACACLNLFGDPTAVIIQESEPVDLTFLSNNNEVEIALSEVLIEGDNVSFSYRLSSSVYNQGGRDAAGFSVQYTAISNDTTYDLGICYINGLNRGKQKNIVCEGKKTLPLGEYKLGQSIDCYNEVYEMTEVNNIHTNPNPLILREEYFSPDLISHDIEITKSNIIFRDNELTFDYEISSEIFNKGLVGTSEGFYIRYLAKSIESSYELGEVKSSESPYELGEIKTSDSIYVLGEYYMEGLNPNELKLATCRGQITLPFGQYEIACSVDYDNSINEVDDDNNYYCDSYPFVVSEDILLPDIMPYSDVELIISDTSITIDGEIEFSYNISSYVKNYGCETSEDFWIQYDLKSDEGVYSLGGYGYVGGLDQNEVKYINNIRGCYRTVPFGEYELICTIDYANEVTESNENNNVHTNNNHVILLREEYAPNFIPLRLDCELSDIFLEEGDEISFTYKISTIISNFGFSTNELFSIDFIAVKGDNTYYLGDDCFNGLDKFEIKSSTEEGRITLPFGEYEIMCVIDYHDRVIELNEDNNIMYYPLNLTKQKYLPDFYSIDDILCDFSNVFSGSDEISFSYDLWANIGNFGYGTANGFYVKYTAVSNEEVYELGTCYIDGLNHNEIKSINCNGTITLPSGYYKLMCHVDCYNDVLEINEDNNIHINSNPIMGTPGSVMIGSTTDKLVGDIFDTHVYIDSGLQRVGAYRFEFHFNPKILRIVDITAGPDGFISSIDIDNSEGVARVSGFDALGPFPSAILDFLTISWKAISVGKSMVEIDIITLADISTNTIGTPNGINCNITVHGDVRISSVTDKYVGDTFSTSVNVDSRSQKLTGYYFNITFDPNIVVPTNFYSAQAGFITSVEKHDSEGWIKVAGYTESWIDPGLNLFLFSISWKAIGVGESAITFDKISLIDDSGEPIETTYIINSHVKTTPIPMRNVSISSVADKKVGDIFDTHVYIDSGRHRVAAYGFEFTFNPTILRIVDIIAGPDGFISSIDINNSEGVARVSGFDALGPFPSPNLDFLIITWETIGVGECVLAIDILTLANEMTDTIDNPVGINSHVIVHPNITLGDVNNDGLINALDATLTTQYFVGLNPEGFFPEAADVNGDGLINTLDSLFIAQYYVGLIDKFPAEL